MIAWSKTKRGAKSIMICVIFNGVLINMYWLIKEPNKGNKQTLQHKIKNKSLMIFVIFTKILINKYCLIEILNEATKQISFTAKTIQIF